MEYIVNVGQSYTVEATDEEEALDQVYHQVADELGDGYAKSAWFAIAD